MTLAQIQPDPTPKPPAHLGEAGRAFWQAIVGDYNVDTADALATLEHAALALDRLAEARAAIATDGLLNAGKAADYELKYLRAFRFAVRELGLSTSETELYTRPPRPVGNRAAGRTD